MCAQSQGTLFWLIDEGATHNSLTLLHASLTLGKNEQLEESFFKKKYDEPKHLLSILLEL